MSMLLRFAIMYLCLISIWGTASEYEVIKLKNGSNQLDLNGDGVKDIVFKGMFDNNTSFVNYSYTFFIKTKYNDFIHVPIGESHSDIIYWDGRLSGIGYLYQDLKLIKFKSILLLVTAVKENHGSFDKEKGLLSFYFLKKGAQHPGQIPYQWIRYNSKHSENKYYSVDEAFDEISDEDLAINNRMDKIKSEPAI
ncbi:hypothetical protein KCM76_20685 [Zooshikella marina]|uniref:carbapenem self-resistance protein CarG family protein n=1 Tax=Zooshikella ganghwensis TaxID=202772 RepID=UPI001BAFF049|nr:hypothetical protein [Zooshikella ganghwensis]MBU2708422.1 hypothetical protein [Zooshikella ganghwensis]